MLVYPKVYAPDIDVFNVAWVEHRETREVAPQSYYLLHSCAF